MKRKTNRILSLLLAFVMAFSLVPTAAAAGSSTIHNHNLIWKHDATQHWQECIAANCPQTIQNLGNHNFGEWKVTQDATCTSIGSREHSCETCGWVASEKTNINPQAHEPKEGSCSPDETNPSVHLYICKLCGKPQSEEHTMKNGKCEKCGYVPPTVTVTGVTLNRTTLTLNPGDTSELTATVSPSDAPNKSVTWKSSDNSVATVEASSTGAIVKANKAGTADITVTTVNGGKTATCRVTVNPTSTSSTILTYNNSYTIDPNTRRDISVSVSANDYRNYNVDYVVWSLDSNSGFYFDDNQSTSSYTRTTDFSYYGSSYTTYSTSIPIRAYNYTSEYSATLTAALYNTSGRVIDRVYIKLYNGYTNSKGFTLSRSPNSTINLGYYYDDRYWNDRYYYENCYVTPYLDNVRIDTNSSYDIYYTWTLNGTTVQNQTRNGSSYKLYADNRSLYSNSRTNTLTCYAEVYSHNAAVTTANRLYNTSISWTVYTDDYYYNNDFTVSATVYDTTSRYNLNDKDDKNGSSIISQISDKLYDYYYSSSYGRDYISYVRFSNVTSSYGNLDASTSRDYYYDSSRSGSYDLRDVDFTPSKTGTASFGCTVYGTRGNTYKCTINIKVEAGTTDKTASTINYSTKGTKSVTLSASDFTSRYKDVVGSSASTLTIKFRNVPSNGTLKYNSTTLTSSNIGNYEFSSSSSASYRISDVTYTPKNNSNSTDTIDYYCYSGSTRRFSGSIKFTNTAETVTVPSGVTVSYSTTGASVTFSAPDFYNKHSAMLSASYIVFGSPTSGTLSSGGSAVASGTKFGYTVDTAKGYKNLASVSYKPASGYNGTATIPFTAYNSDGTTAATGNVSILVSQTTTTTTPTTPTNTAKTFKDVASTAWYANDVAALSAAGIVSGDNNGNFRPQDAVTYGEALKMVLIASGYPKQNELTGANWAQNYLTQAISNSILSGSASDYTLSKSINRTAMATVAAKALKLTPVTNAASSPYTDTSDSYVLALTNAGIVQGDASSGQTKWRGGDTLTRAEMSRIVYNIYKYRNVAPGGSSTSTDTSSKPDWLK